MMQQNRGTTYSNEKIREEPGSELSRLIFVGGAARSGTTLVQRILNFHPEIYGGPEFVYVPRIMALFRDMRASVRSGRIDCLLTEQALVQAFRNFLSALLLPKLRAEGALYLSEKTPDNALVFPWIENCAPEAKKILVLRDPRDVVSSMLEVGQRERELNGKATSFVRDPIAAVDYLNQCLKEGTSLAKESDNCLLVYYEDVVAEPLATANRMFRFIGVREIDRLNLESKNFDVPRDQERFSAWHTAKTKSGPVHKGRVGFARRRLKRGEWDYVCAKTIRHPYLERRYSIPPRRWTAPAAWCVVRCLAGRMKENLPRLFVRVRQLLNQRKQDPS